MGHQTSMGNSKTHAVAEELWNVTNIDDKTNTLTKEL